MESQRVEHNWVSSLSLFTFKLSEALEAGCRYITFGKTLRFHSVSSHEENMACLLVSSVHHPGVLPVSSVHHPESLKFANTPLNWNAQVGRKKESGVAQSCLTLCDPMDCSLPGSSVHGIFQAIVLAWASISFSRGSSQPRDRTRVSRIVDRHVTFWATREVLYHQVGRVKANPGRQCHLQFLALMRILGSRVEATTRWLPSILNHLVKWNRNLCWTCRCHLF